jgi:hypothetical protein
LSAAAPPRSRRIDDEVFVACGLVWAVALIHALAALAALATSSLATAVLAAVALAELAAGVIVYRRPSRAVLGAVAGAGVVLLAVWVLSRTVGLPVGAAPGRRQPVGPLDALAMLDELAFIAVVALRLWAPAGVGALSLLRRVPSAAGILLVIASSLAFLDFRPARAGVGGSGYVFFCPLGHAVGGSQVTVR